MWSDFDVNEDAMMCLSDIPKFSDVCAIVLQINLVCEQQSVIYYVYGLV